MMQHPDGRDDVESAGEVPELEDVGLRILNIRNAELPRLAYGIADAAQAEVYCQDTETSEPLGHDNRLTSGAAPRDEHLWRLSSAWA